MKNNSPPPGTNKAACLRGRNLSSIVAISFFCLLNLCRNFQFTRTWWITTRPVEATTTPQVVSHAPTFQEPVYPPECEGRQQFWRILVDAGVPNAEQFCLENHHRKKDTNDTSRARRTYPVLPFWSEMVQLYGAEPRIIRQCPIRRSVDSLRNDSTKNSSVLLPVISGLYNTGTNALVKLLRLNLAQLKDNWFYHNASEEMRATWPYAWNEDLKATVLNFFDNKHAGRYQKRPPSPQSSNPSAEPEFLRVVIVRDPYRWMQSVCSSPYDVVWNRVKSEVYFSRNETVSFQTTRTVRVSAASRHGVRAGYNNCPNMIDANQLRVFLSVLEPSHRPNQTIDHVIKASTPKTRMTYPTLAHMWNQWYLEYLLPESLQRPGTSQNSVNHTMTDEYSKEDLEGKPYIAIRFEDLLFHAPAVIQAIAECAGMDLLFDPPSHHASDIPSPPHQHSPRGKFQYVREQSKNHGSHHGLVEAMVQSGRRSGRTKRFDRTYLSSVVLPTLNPELMRMFHYPFSTVVE